MIEHPVDRVAQWLDGTLPADDLPPPEIWACVETAPLLGEEERFETFFYGGSSIFSFTPMTEEAARQWADRNKPMPIKSLDRLPSPECEYDDDMPF